MRKLILSLTTGLLITVFASGAQAADAGGAAASSAGASAGQSGHAEAIHWSTWSESAFERAQSEKKPVILDLEAVWCHWCHVMDGKTYGDPKIAALINSRFVAVRVDQDSRPDLSTRYQDYGWPATIFFSPGGKEIIKHAGYIPPEQMVKMLRSVLTDPNKPRASAEAGRAVGYTSATSLSGDLSNELIEQNLRGYDTNFGGWGSGHKFLDWDTVEYCINRARAGDAKYEAMARSTLSGELKLVDPVWGGVYQYSTNGDWDHPHFEKIMQMQAENMRLFSLAYSAFHDSAYRKGARDIADFLFTFLTGPDGAFYTSMDADLISGEHGGEYFRLNDAERRKQGVPRIDRHVYSRENGWAITGLTALYAATGDNQLLDRSLKAANWILANRSLAGGGFSHDRKDEGGPFLDDTLAMGRAFLSLYGATGERQWLERAEQAADFLDQHFKLTLGGGRSSGYAASAATASAAAAGPLPDVDENVMVARFANLLYQYSGRKSDLNIAETAMHFLGTPVVARGCGIYTAGILLADCELNSHPVHVTVVGSKNDALARALMLEALKYPSGYRVVEWWDRKDGPLPRMEVEFPQLARSAAFACAGERCSTPAYEPGDLKAAIDAMR